MAAAVRRNRLSKLCQIFRDRTANFAGEDLGKRRNGTGGLVKRDALNAVHGKEKRGQAGALLIRSIDLVDEVIEGVEIDAPHGNSRRMNSEQFAPKLFLGGVKANDDDRMGFHGFASLRLTQFRDD